MATSLDLFRLDGARALVTGASRGIGKAVAVSLAEAGCDVVVTARTLGALEETVRDVEERGRKAVALAGDLGEAGVTARLVDAAAQALGGLDVVVHNAGVTPADADGGMLLAPLQELPEAAWDTVMSVNLDATGALCRAAHPHLAESSRASLILMSSTAAVLGAPLLDSYAATKAAQVSLAKSLAVGWARQGIRVNAVCPGWTLTDMTAFASEVAPVSEWLMAHVPMGRWASVEEITGSVLFLASPAASYVTGHALIVDGGLSVPDGGLAGYAKPPSPLAS
ncbi:SDR family oxidoreductase [Streptomyces roseirectus]|uniref:SDR family oxidoreductase n=1 Tax=Streptomyces roseirectus TaxID=2768066 RepID=A0A7H0INP3_9ACTN|nr:SDR family NAD(P)-dependent oxidoreductase [Streptomyces roseirectus]QNP74409.1 SDR family oxidoreductase [Streptomyces roseirectus]